jgi:hypothetical protein
LVGAQKLRHRRFIITEIDRNEAHPNPGRDAVHYDESIALSNRYGLLRPEALPFVPEGRVCFGPGAGESLVIADADCRLIVAYVMNKIAVSGPYLIVSPVSAALVERVYDIVGC